MSVSAKASLQLALGEFEDRLSQSIDKAKNDNLVERIWSRDHTAWKSEPTEITNRLGWLDFARRMHGEIRPLETFAQEAKNDGVRKVLLLGMGGSSLAPELFAKLFGNGELQLSVLDSTDPDAVTAANKAHDPAETIYIVSSKSGGTVETASFFKYFYNQAKVKLGGATGEHFVAITDPGSGLAKTGEQFGFRKVFLADPNIGGRYSALSHFGLVPAALVGVDLERLLARAESMAEQCRLPIDENPGTLLGLALGTLAKHGRDKVTFSLPTVFASFGDWVEQLIAESTGKEGKGLLPVAGEPALDSYSNDRVFVHIGTLPRAGQPAIAMDLVDKYDIGGLFFLWEFATVVAGYVLDINPFDQPNVEAAKVQARQVMDAYQKTGTLPKGETTVLEANLLDKFLKQAKPGDYIAFQVYAAPSKQLTASMQDLRRAIGNKYLVATTLGYGPRFLHSTGQLHKGDAGNGLFVQFVTPPPAGDVPIPADAGKPQSDINFGVLKLAQAVGDAQALHAAGRRVISFEVSEDLEPQIRASASSLK